MKIFILKITYNINTFRSCAPYKRGARRALPSAADGICYGKIRTDYVFFNNNNILYLYTKFHILESTFTMYRFLTS